MAEKLTKKQTEVLQFIKKYVVKYGYAPTVREICNGLGLSSPATVHSHLAQLQNKGMITKGKGKFRTIEVLCENEFLNKKVEVIKVPFVSMNCKRNVLLELDKPKKLFSIPVELAPAKKNVYAFRVNDDYLDYGIKNDDIIIVRRINTLNDGDLILYLDSDSVLSLGIYSDDLLDKIVSVIGKVTGLYRKF